MIKHDAYTINARFFPALISSLPLFVLWYFTVRLPEWKGLCEFLLSLKFLGSISLSLIFLYFYSQFIRITSKFLERKYFLNARGFPTTYFMLYGDQSYSTDYKNQFRARVKKAFKLQPLDADGELANPLEGRRRVTESVDQIRLKIGDGKLVLKHNIWYGFSRNLIGGAIYSVIFCISNIFVGVFILKEIPLITGSAILLCVYGIILLFHRAILVQNAEAYARQLLAEFMTSTTPRR